MEHVSHRSQVVARASRPLIPALVRQGNAMANGPQEPTNADLVLRHQQGDREALGVLYRRVYESLLLYAKRQLDNDGERANDAVSETWVVFLSRVNDFKVDNPGGVWSFLCRTLINRCYEERRARDRARRGGGQDALLQGVPGGEDPVREAENRELRDLVRTFLERLRPNEREIAARVLEGMSHERIMEELGLTKHRVQTDRSSFLEKIRACLKQAGW